ncbi:MAG: sulfatase [archaeon]
MKAGETFFFILLIASMALIVGCEKKPDYACEGCNVIIISLDALRADHLPCYGYSRNTSPNICELGENGVLFTNAFSNAASTLSSFSSVFTSQYPSVHNAGEYSIMLSERKTTLAEILKKEGYSTVAFTGGGFLSSGWNLDQGFDTYESGESNESLQDAMAWIDRNGHEKFFLFVHFYKPHSPYASPDDFNELYADKAYDGKLKGSPLDDDFMNEVNAGRLNLSAEDISYLNARYDGAIRFIDSYVSQLISSLKESGAYNNSLVILMSDHGENLMNRKGQVGHGDFYDEQVHIPLIAHYPYPVGSIRSDSLVESVDVMPTILDIIKLPAGGDADGVFQGISLLPGMDGAKDAPENKFVFAEKVMRKEGELCSAFFLTFQAVATRESKYCDRCSFEDRYGCISVMTRNASHCQDYLPNARLQTFCMDFYDYVSKNAKSGISCNQTSDETLMPICQSLLLRKSIEETCDISLGQMARPLVITMVRSKDHKLIHGYGDELYGLGNDPDEKNNLIGTGLQAEINLRSELARFRAWNDNLSDDEDYILIPGSFEYETREKMRSLGYIS